MFFFPSSSSPFFVFWNRTRNEYRKGGNMSALYFYFYILYKDLSDYRKAGRQAGRQGPYIHKSERERPTRWDWCMASSSSNNNNISIWNGRLKGSRRSTQYPVVVNPRSSFSLSLLQLFSSSFFSSSPLIESFFFLALFCSFSHLRWWKHCVVVVVVVFCVAKTTTFSSLSSSLLKSFPFFDCTQEAPVVAVVTPLFLFFAPVYTPVAGNIQ